MMKKVLMLMMTVMMAMTMMMKVACSNTSPQRATPLSRPSHTTTELCKLHKYKYKSTNTNTQVQILKYKSTLKAQSHHR